MINAILEEYLSKSSLIEVVGLGGTGKTSFGYENFFKNLIIRIQLALKHLRSSSDSHTNKEVLWIDTVGSFPWKRLSQLIDEDEEKTLLDSFIVWQFSDLSLLIETIKGWIGISDNESYDDNYDDKRSVLVIIDNVSNLFRPNKYPTLQGRIEDIRRFGGLLRHLSLKMECPIICINQMSSKINHCSAENIFSSSQPQYNVALGINWSIMVDLSMELRYSFDVNDSPIVIDGKEEIVRGIVIKKMDYNDSCEFYYKDKEGEEGNINIIKKMDDDLNHHPKEEIFIISSKKVLIME